MQEYIITITSTITIQANNFEEITIEQIKQQLNKNNIIIEKVTKKRK